MSVDKSLIKELKNFHKEISVDYPIKKMILFGSRAKGRERENSDVDLLLVSKKFLGKRRLKRSPDLYLRWNLDYPVDFVCLTPKEFENKKKEIGIVQEAVKDGVEI